MNAYFNQFYKYPTTAGHLSKQIRFFPVTYLDFHLSNQPGLEIISFRITLMVKLK